MKKLLLLLPLLIAAKCSDLPYPPPPIELCGIGSSQLICNDPRLPEADQNYKRDPKAGDLCTNGDDLTLIKEDNIELRLKLYKLEKQCKL